MALPVISQRPIKTISGYDSVWNAGGGDLPILYEITNDKFPTNSLTSSPLAFTISTSDSRGRAILTVASSAGVSADQYIEILSGLYEGIFRVVAVPDGTSITINTPYTEDSTATYNETAYADYKTEVDIYVGIASGHPLNAVDPIALVGTMSLIPDSDNVTYADIKSYVQKNLSTFNNAGASNDTLLWTNFYIACRESYKTVFGTTTTSSDVTDSASTTLYAANGVLQFQNIYGGNMYEYTADTGLVAKWLSTNPSYFFINRPYWDISAIVNVDTFDLVAVQYDRNGNILQTDTVNYAGDGPGLYRFQLSGVLIGTNTARVQVTLQISSVDVTEVMTVYVDDSLCIDNETPEIGNFMLYEDGDIMDFENNDNMLYEL